MIVSLLLMLLLHISERQCAIFFLSCWTCVVLVSLPVTVCQTPSVSLATLGYIGFNSLTLPLGFLINNLSFEFAGSMMACPPLHLYFNLVQSLFDGSIAPPVALISDSCSVKLFCVCFPVACPKVHFS